MHLLLLGISHKTAPVELREQLDFSTGRLADALRTLRRRRALAEAVILSTCNRAEIYAASPTPEAARHDMLAFLGEHSGLDKASLEPHLYERLDIEAARHLFRVAGSLDSLVVGEPQILGQVKDAFSAASDQRTVGPLLTRLFHWSFGVGKRVRRETQLAEGPVSISYAAVALAKKIFGDLAGRRVLVIGAGEMGKLTAMHLRAQGIAEILITNRTMPRAQALAAAVGGSPIPWDTLPSALHRADIVVTATGSPAPILDRPRVETVMRTRRQRPLFVIDIAVPRDVDPAVGAMEEVFLYNIDDLQDIVRDNLSRRRSEVARAEAIVSEETDRFAAWFRARNAIPTVVALRQRFEAVRRTELERLQPKLAALSPDARHRLDEITRLIVEKLLLTPTEQLKALNDPELVNVYAEALNRLFGLASESSSGEQAAAGAGTADAGPPGGAAERSAGRSADPAGTGQDDRPPGVSGPGEFDEVQAGRRD